MCPILPPFFVTVFRKNLTREGGDFMYKRIIALTVAFLLLLSMSAFAAEQRLTVPAPNLSFSGTTAYCNVSVSDYGSDINVNINNNNSSILFNIWIRTN